MSLRNVLNAAINTIDSDILETFKSSDAVIYSCKNKFEFLVNEDNESYHFAICPEFAKFLNQERKFDIIETKILHNPLNHLSLVQDETHFLFRSRNREEYDCIVFAFQKEMIDDTLLTACFLFHKV